ncbi:serine protease [Roseofilum sp. BLCC_M91]|uniref:Serine protease n=1 Tax=Roseofilum halophilum BLCC-M91 TaxID=3022259 RepID=A0ABT7BPH8_9CYAN|nr:serine protease [Roseofilum halophilum]MDJ1180439.1 serine protease [Roseofilum halophilum BLCC-M91]
MTKPVVALLACGMCGLVWHYGPLEPVLDDRPLTTVPISWHYGPLQPQLDDRPSWTTVPTTPVSPAKSPQELRQIARAIAVKVIAGTSHGSGIILGREGETYQVVTNRHVLTASDTYKIQTSDGQVYAAIQVTAIDFRGKDLALLTFRSDRPYTLASIAEVSSVVKSEVFAAGFPLQSPPDAAEDGFVFNQGTLQWLLEQPLADGYQMGYDNDIRKGMSGGPLLNNRGEVIGINGMHAYPLWGNPYIYADGSQPDPLLRETLIALSWAIPIGLFQSLSSFEVLSQESGEVHPMPPVPPSHSELVW